MVRKKVRQTAVCLLTVGALAGALPVSVWAQDILIRGDKASVQEEGSAGEESSRPREDAARKEETNLKEDTDLKKGWI